jgi:hypothetical protein
MIEAFSETENHLGRYEAEVNELISELMKSQKNPVKGRTGLEEIDEIIDSSDEIDIYQFMLDTIKWESMISNDDGDGPEKYRLCHRIVGWMIQSASAEKLGHILLSQLKTDDVAFKEALYWHLKHLYGQNPSYEFLKPILAKNPDNPPKEIVDFMFTVSRDLAYKTFSEVYGEPKDSFELFIERSRIIAKDIIKNRGRRPEVLPVKTDEEAEDQLAILAQDDRWYARRYAVEVMKDSPPHCREVLVQLLRQDPHPLVREAAQEVECPVPKE